MQMQSRAARRYECQGSAVAEILVRVLHVSPEFINGRLPFNNSEEVGEKKRSEREAARKEGRKENLKGNFYGLLTVTESLKREAHRLCRFPMPKSQTLPIGRWPNERTNEGSREQRNCDMRELERRETHSWRCSGCFSQCAGYEGGRQRRRPVGRASARGTGRSRWLWLAPLFLLLSLGRLPRSVGLSRGSQK